MLLQRLLKKKGFNILSAHIPTFFIEEREKEKVTKGNIIGEER
jgi:hypothetical protein